MFRVVLGRKADAHGRSVQQPDGPAALSKAPPPSKSKPKKNLPPKTKPPPPPPKEEEPSSIFASLGKTVMNFAGLATDDQTVNTTGSVKYPGTSAIPIKASANAAKAQDTANEMAEELNKLMNSDGADIPAASGNDDYEFDWRADNSDSGVDVGSPTVEGATVAAELVEQLRGKKVRVFKKKRRKNYRRKRGHRQLQTVLRIRDIQGA